MNRLERVAYERIPSFRREEGGSYAVYVAVYSRAYRLAMRWQHRGVGRAAYRTAESPPIPLADFSALIEGRSRSMRAHCRKRTGYCNWCGGGTRTGVTS